MISVDGISNDLVNVTLCNDSFFPYCSRQGSLEGDPIVKDPAGILHHPAAHPVHPAAGDQDEVLLPMSHFLHLSPALTAPSL